MSEIDLKEIRDREDTFEFFARDFLQAIGLKIVEGPGRGADGGRDLLVKEIVTGRITSSDKLWLLSAKHRAHSNKSVSDVDEKDPIGRVRKFKAQGFMAFYSTIPSSGLDNTLSRIKSEIEVYVWDAGRIENALISDPRLKNVFRQYLPESYKKTLSKKPSNVFGEVEPLECDTCHKNILFSDSALVAFVEKIEGDKTIICDLYSACKGDCDRFLTSKLDRKYITAWGDISDLRIPVVFMNFVIATLNRIWSKNYIYEGMAYEKNKVFILKMSQAVMRETNEEMWDRIRTLKKIPSFLGGLG